MTDKRCNGCGEIKPVANFKKHTKSKDGYTQICKACIAAERGQIIMPDPTRRPGGLKQERVDEIRRLRRQGWTVPQLCAKFDEDWYFIRDIVCERTYM